jgi:hypothetical protein
MSVPCPATKFARSLICHRRSQNVSGHLAFECGDGCPLGRLLDRFGSLIPLASFSALKCRSGRFTPPIVRCYRRAARCKVCRGSNRCGLTAHWHVKGTEPALDWRQRACPDFGIQGLGRLLAFNLLVLTHPSEGNHCRLFEVEIVVAHEAGSPEYRPDSGR